ncbi:MAG: hypothetical protein Q8P49_02355 [Candidatus Liptonbacteria bacterium]|nr:hypothetical protein [Candidatus Liptonbacteria bacterium]
MTLFELKWRSPEFEYRPKDVSWYWISIIVSVIVLGLAVWQKNFLFGFFVVIAEILIIVYANREPAFVEFTLNEKGIAIDGRKSYAYADMESWSIDSSIGTEWPSLFFQFHRRLKPPLKVRIPRDRIAELQKALATVLRQVEHEHSLLDALEEFIGF